MLADEHATAGRAARADLRDPEAGIALALRKLHWTREVLRVSRTEPRPEELGVRAPRIPRLQRDRREPLAVARELGVVLPRRMRILRRAEPELEVVLPEHHAVSLLAEREEAAGHDPEPQPRAAVACVE